MPALAAPPRAIPGLPALCLDACDGDGPAALHLAVRMTRLRMIERGELEPVDGEDLPEFMCQPRFGGSAPHS